MGRACVQLGLGFGMDLGQAGVGVGQGSGRARVLGLAWAFVRLTSCGAKIGSDSSLGLACVQLGLGFGVALGQAGIRWG